MGPLKYFTLFFTLVTFTTSAFASGLGARITQMPYGTTLTVQKEIFIPAHETYFLLNNGFAESDDFDREYAFSIKLKKHSRDRKLKIGRSLTVTSVSAPYKKKCNEDIDRSYKTIRIFVDNPHIEYILVESGTYSYYEEKCGSNNFSIRRLNNSSYTGNYFSVTLPGADEI